MIKWIANFFWKLYKILTHRMFLTVILLLVQFVVMYLMLYYANDYSVYVQGVFQFISVLMIIYILNQDDNPNEKMSFIMFIALIPFFGVPFYIIWRGKTVHEKYRLTLEKSHNQVKHLHMQDESVGNELRELDRKRYREAEYVYRESDFPVHKNTSTKYYPSAEALYEELLPALENAKHFIFMEFFIIKHGEMFDTIMEILKRKVKEGVEVRFMYDDFGCAGNLPMHYDRELKEMGIEGVIFNPFNPRLTINHNFRDHRKIIVIDGYIGFTGGLNLADEYINKISPYGYWKDSGIRLEGDAVWNLTVSFLENWDFASESHSDYALFTPHRYHEESFEALDDGYVMPYADNPLDDEELGQSVYVNMINNAVDYIWFTTPYLVLETSVQNALELAAKRGVDVRIITPGIPDNKIHTYVVTRSTYRHLIQNGVRIYEYTQGFVHAKNVLSDDEVMSCGTINLDYRSMYHNFENGVWVYRSKSIEDMKKDFLQVMEVSKEIDMDWVKKRPLTQRFAQYIYRIMSPFL
ncbi:MAG: cardiolipin synthase [Erysipelotrichales bacterium]|nr:cardiolipin synthase [Erysipelotrichales bacterium]